MEDSKLETITKKVSITFGIALLAASVYLSYDGFDQKVAGGNSTYSILAIAIGVSLAIVCTLLQFIVASKNDNLNSTLRWLGAAAYAYSIGTNYLGLTNLLEMNKVMAGIVAAFMDIAPEQIIAWGLGEAVMHDLFGNFGKFAAAPIGKKSGGGNKGGGQQNQQRQDHGHGDQRPQQNQRYPVPQQGRGNVNHQGGSNRRAQLEAQYRKQVNFDELTDTGKMRALRRELE